MHSFSTSKWKARVSRKSWRVWLSMCPKATLCFFSYCIGFNVAFRVLSYPSLRHSVGMGRREPWERGWKSPFSLLLILRLSAPVSWLNLVDDLGEIKGVGVKMRGDFSTVGHCLELANPVQIFFDGCEDKKRFSSRVVVSFTVVFRYTKVTRKAAKI